MYLSLHIQANRKLTLGEIGEVHDCEILDDELVFIVKLRLTDSIAKVKRKDINTNSLRHAVPFSSLCDKHGVKSVDELEKKLINDQKNNSKDNNNKRECKSGSLSKSKPFTLKSRTPTIEITCDPNSSLKNLASIAHVVNKTAEQSPQINSISSKSGSMSISGALTTQKLQQFNLAQAEDEDGDNEANENDKDEEEDDNDNEPEFEVPTEKITYNLRSKKRKFKEINNEQKPSKKTKSKSNSKNIVDLTPDESDGGDTETTTNSIKKPNTTQSISRPRARLRPQSLRPIPHSVHLGPSPSPTKMFAHSASAPNTPILNSSKQSTTGTPSTPVINLINSPQVNGHIPAPLQFPQISLPQGQFTLLGPLKFPHGATPNNMSVNNNVNRINTMNNMNNMNNTNPRLNGINGLNAKSLQQLQQLILLQKKMSETNFGQKVNLNSLTQQLNHNHVSTIQPLQKPLPRLESEGGNDTKSKPTEGHKEPPTKKQKLLNGMAKIVDPKQKASNSNSKDSKDTTMGEQFWSERLLSVFIMYFPFFLFFCACYGLERNLNMSDI